MNHYKRHISTGAVAAVFFFALIASQMAWGGIQCNQDADCNDGTYCNGEEVCVTNQEYPNQCCVGYPAAPGCVPCADKITQLTLLNEGQTGYVRVYKGKRPNPYKILFEGWVTAGDTFTFTGRGGGEMGQQISIWVGNDRECLINTIIHTSCNNTVGPGLVRGDFVVVEAHTPEGLLCPICPLPCDPPLACNEVTGTCSGCIVDGDCDDGTVCNGLETCVDYQCVPGTPPDCEDGNVCTNDYCDPLTGCQNVNNAATCDLDDNLCTLDHCVDGTCQPGSSVVCDDGDGCTEDTCDPATGHCVHTPLPACECDEDSDCDDDNVCTVNDYCDLLTNECVAGTLVVCDDGSVCTDDSCNPATGVCQFTANQEPCNDGNECTTGDTCANGQCSGTPIDPAVECTDDDECTLDTCDSNSGCENTGIPGCACDADDDCIDTNPCNGVESCNVLTNECVAGAPVVCDDGTICTDDSCNPATGVCQFTANQEPCNDGNECTTGDTCANGQCSGTPIDPAVDCTDDDECTLDTCDPNSGCENTGIPGCECDADDDCIDTNPCNGVESCNVLTNECVAGAPVVCDDGTICTDDSCNPATGVCQFTANQEPCNDGNECTTGDTCANGQCSGTPIDPAVECTDGDECTLDTCDPNSGCENTGIPGCECDADDDCIDTNSCDGVESCNVLTNECVAGIPVVCDDGTICTDDSCNPATGECDHLNNASPCDDEDACTAGDQCAGGSCQPGTPVACADNDNCTIDTCDYLEGCKYEQLPDCCDSDSECADGNPCNGIESCDLLTNDCVAGTPVVCDDGTICTDDSCNPATGVCQFTANQEPCNDGSECTTGDTCANGQCSGTPIDPAVECTDGDECTLDTCDPNSGCENTGIPGCACDADDDCIDTNPCNGVESCNVLTNECVAGTPVVCDDGTICTDDSCNPATGVCQFTANQEPCNDGDDCTTGDTCANGQCSGTPIDPAVECTDGDECTLDTCDPNSGCENTGIPGCACDADDDCIDTNPCNGVESCNVLTNECVAGTPVVCDDGKVCTDDSCNPATGVCQFTANQEPCNDGDDCTTGDTCANGQCSGTPIDPAVECTDGDECTLDTCDPNSGCENTGIPGCACDADDDCIDTNPCNGVESCNVLTNECVAGTPVVCDDGKVCTDDSCNPATGECDHLNNASPCDDEDVCTESDQCAGGNCQPGTPLVCNDGNVCTDDACNPTSGCVYTNNNNTPCDDDIFCNGDDTCSGGNCSIHDGDPCSSGTECNEGTDTCDSTTTTTPITTTTTTVPGETDVVFQQSSIYYNPTEGGGETVKRKICLDNPGDLVGGLQFDLCEYDDEMGEEPVDCMECIACELTERTPMFDCVVLELPNGCCRVIMFCKNPGCAINPGLCDIVTIVHKTFPLSEECPGMECGFHIPENMVVSDYNGYSLTATALPGEVCPYACGDVCPPDGPGPGWNCGDGVVDIYDIMCEVNFALGTLTDSCQLYRADVPTGTPGFDELLGEAHGCAEPDGVVNILDIMVLIDMTLHRQDCCSFYYQGIIY